MLIDHFGRLPAIAPVPLVSVVKHRFPKVSQVIHVHEPSVCQKSYLRAQKIQISA